MKKLSRLVSLILCVAMLISMTATYVYAANSTATFTDVPTTHWANSCIEYWASKGIVTGIGNQNFNPDGLVTYAQFSVMVMKAFFPNAVIVEGGAWYEPYMNAARTAHLFHRTNVSVTNKYAEQPVSRYEAASIVDNVLASQDITIRTDQRTQAMQAITDFKKIPIEYQGAVVDCYALEIISGYTDGRFVGTDTLTRAQACVILNALEKVVLAGPQSGNASSGDSSSSGDNSSNGTAAAGVLANGKPITEANVKEILAQIEKDYPTGTPWTNVQTNPNTMFNPNPVSKTVTTTLMSKHNCDTKYACSGFAAMVSDLVFGTDGNPVRKLDDVSETRPGDIIIRLRANGRVDHVMIATSTPDANGYIYLTDGNCDSAVSWAGVIREKSVISTGMTLVVYTRYPD